MATNYRQIARQFAEQAGVDPDIFERQIQQESGFRPGVRSGAGAIGIAQIMPATAKGWGVDPTDPIASLRAAANAMGKYLRSYKGDYAKALAAYNAGVGAVAKYNGVPPYKETQHYVKTILAGGPAVRGVAAGGPTAGQPAVQKAMTDPFAKMREISKNRMGLFSDDEKGSSDLDKLAQGKWDLLDALKGVRGEPLSSQPDVAGGIRLSGAGAGSVDTLPRRKGEKGYQYLQRLGTQLFGLRNDPGNSQTTGGQHTQGSYHYSGNAIDFGDARNSRDQLNAWYRFLDQNRDRLGLLELLDEGDHIHAAARKGVRKR